MIKQKKISNKYIFSIPFLACFLFLLLGLFTIGCFFDYQISRCINLSVKNTLIFTTTCISNIFLLIGFASVELILFVFIFSSAIYKNKNNKKYYSSTIIGILLLLFVFAFGNLQFKYWNSIVNQFIWRVVINSSILIVFTLSSFFISFFWVRMLNQNKSYVSSLWFIIFTLILSIIVLLLNLAWSRPRPVLIFKQPNPNEYFKPVWIISPFACFNKNIEGHELMRSFPSGHTLIAAMIAGAICCIYNIDSNQNKTNQNMIRIIFIALPLLMGLNRMLSLNHFLTDISCSCILSVCFYSGFEYKINKYKSSENL